MHIALAAVMSADGKLTRHDQPDIYEWVSAEDQTHFQSLINRHDAIVMGRGTYQSIKHHLKLSPERLRVVLTTHPESFADQSVPDQLEFINETPTDLMKSLKVRNFQNILIVGGSQIITDFLAAKLINEIYLTVEPRLFGTGQPLTAAIPQDIQLKLKAHKKLNDAGTLLLTYHVL